MIRYLPDFLDNPPALVALLAAWAVAYVTGITFHEFSHAWAANELGDSTAARQGRLTLNPMAHLDPWGTVLFLVVGFGWGRPTPVNPYNLRNGTKRGNAMVAVAGPAANFFVAILAAIPLRTGMIPSIASFNGIRDASGMEIVGLFLLIVIFLNVILGVFNLIPIHPLDGFKVAVGVLPGELSRQLNALAPWGPGILMTLIVIGFVAPRYSPIFWILDFVANRIFDILL